MESENRQVKPDGVKKRVVSLKTNAIYNTLRTLMQIVFPLITFPYASRVLMPEGLGKVNFSATIIGYFAVFASLGISTYGTREIAKCRDDRNLLSKKVKEIFTINLIATATAYIAFFVAVFIVPKFSEYRLLLFIYSATILFTTLGIEWIYSGLEDYRYITIRSIIFQVISLVLLFSLVKTKDDYIKYACISVFANVGSNICNFIHSSKYLVKVKEKLEFRRHLKPVFILFAKTLAVSIYTMLDVAMLGFMLGDASVGIYTTATKITKTIESLVIAATAVFMPRLSYYAEKGDVADFNSLLNKSLNFLLMFSIPMVAGLVLLAEPLVLLFSGSRFVESIPVMRIMSPLLLVLAVSNFTGIQIFIPLRKEIYILIATVLGAAINFTLNFILIPRLGVAGAGIASVSAEGCVTVTQLVFARKLFAFGRIIKPLLQYLAGTVVLGAAVYFLNSVIPSMLASVLMCAAAGAGVYALVLFLFRNEFFLQMAGMIRDRIWRKGK